MTFRARLSSLLLLAICVVSGCTSVPVRHAHQRVNPRYSERVWVVSNRFHSSLAVRATDAPPLLREWKPKAAFFVIGWGGRGLYMRKEVKPWQWFTSIALPGDSALHVIPVRKSLTEACAKSDILELRITPAGRDRLVKRIKAALARDSKGHLVVAGPGKLPNSRFFLGRETYFIPKTCNGWVAESLKTAGVPLRAAATFTAGGLFSQGRRHGEIVGTFSKPGDLL